MRTKEFTFKKTKRVKTVTEHPAISVDLTVSEARLLAYHLNAVPTVEEEDECPDADAGESMYLLWVTLDDFVTRNG